MVTVCKCFGFDSTFCDWCRLSHEIVKAARKKASKVCWQCFAETFRETRFKELAANVMQKIGNRGGVLIWVVVSALCADSFGTQARRYSKQGHCRNRCLFVCTRG
jgi:hypothetical protein